MNPWGQGYPQLHILFVRDEGQWYYDENLGTKQPTVINFVLALYLTLHVPKSTKDLAK